MKKLYFKDIEEFVENFMYDYDCSDVEDKDFSIVAKYEEAKEIVQQLLLVGCHLKSIILHDEIVNGYCDEYIITVASIEEDDDYEIWCEPMVIEGCYIRDFSTKTFILDNCSSRVIPNCIVDTKYEVTIGERDCTPECGYICCERCDYCCNSEENNEVSTTKDTYTVNGKTVSKAVFDEYDAAIKKRIKEFEEEMDAFRRRLFR